MFRAGGTQLSFHYFAQTPPDFLEIVAKISGVSAFDLREFKHKVFSKYRDQTSNLLWSLAVSARIKVVVVRS